MKITHNFINLVETLVECEFEAIMIKEANIQPYFFAKITHNSIDCQLGTKSGPISIQANVDEKGWAIAFISLTNYEVIGPVLQATSNVNVCCKGNEKPSCVGKVEVNRKNSYVKNEIAEKHYALCIVLHICITIKQRFRFE